MRRSFQKFTRKLDQIGLRRELEKRVLEMQVSLRELYDGPRTQSIATARRDVYTWLTDEGKSVREIAQLFDRAPNGVLKMIRNEATMRKARGRAKTL
jgi:hypothetical protein